MRARALVIPLLTLLPTVAVAQVDPLVDPSRRDAARVAAAANPLGTPHRDRANRTKSQFGLGAADDLVVLRAHQDQLGWTHVRLQQRTHGLRVKTAEVISHADAAGVYQPYTIATVPGITTSPVATISASDAIRRIESDPRHARPFIGTPSTELIYLPRRSWVLIATGGPVPPPEFDPFAPQPVPSSIGADNVEQRVTSVPLVWEVRAAEGDSTRRDYDARAWYVDAHSGVILEVRDLDDPAVGSGMGRRVGPVTFQTKNEGSCFRMEDTIRSFATEDEDNSAGHPVNCDSNNVWGDGQMFAGDASASNTNRQTAMVDVHFGATVYWDLLETNFGLAGPDGDFYSVNAFVHDGTNWDNAKYHSLSGNVSFGDGNGPPYNGERTVLDCTGHELGHAFNDHQIDWDGDTDHLNESLGDIFGEMTEAYFVSGGFANGTTVIGSNSHVTFVNECSGRSFINPSISMWWSGIDDIEQHSGSQPSTRAFGFLARGASPFLRDPSYSPRLPWGTRGSGFHTAATIYFNAVMSFATSSTNYPGLRAIMIFAAQLIYGFNSPMIAQVENAYAGINVGNRTASYPMLPATTLEIEPNDQVNTAQVLQFNVPPASGAVGPRPPGATVAAPRKIKIAAGSGSSTDVYRMSVPSGRPITARLTPTNPFASSTVQIDTFFQATTAGTALNGSVTITQMSPQCSGAPTCTVFVRVFPSGGSGYVLDLDSEQ